MKTQYPQLHPTSRESNPDCSIYCIPKTLYKYTQMCSEKIGKVQQLLGLNYIECEVCSYLDYSVCLVQQ